MRIAAVSARRGTGRTTVAVNLALTVPGKVRLLDCDVENPKCGPIAHPIIHVHCPVLVRVPVVNARACSGCGDCVEACRFDALTKLPKGVLLLSEICHACGGCSAACTMGALTDQERDVGTLERGTAGVLEFAQGRMGSGETMYPPVVDAVMRLATEDRVNIIDLPPSPIRRRTILAGDCDYAILVAEASPAGLDDLGLSVAAARASEIPVGVALNRVCSENEALGRDYCRENDLPILLELPDDPRIREARSRGEAVVDVLPEFRAVFEGIPAQIPGFCAVPLG